MRVITAGAVVFLAWLTMKFHMDNANDSETHAYVGTLLWNLDHTTLSADATGHYTGIAGYVLWPFANLWNLVSDAYEIRGLALTLFVLALVIYALAYAWYRRLGLGWLTSLLGLMLLSIAVVFAMLVRGWELDKLIEPVLVLAAGLAVWQRRYLVFVGLAALAAANRETGVFAPLIALAALSVQRDSWRSALTSWPVWLAAAISVIEVVWLRSMLPPTGVRPFSDLSLDRLVYITGGVCLVPLLAVVWRSAASREMRRLLYLLGPLWLVFVLATDRLEQGALLLGPVALIYVPITLAGLQQAARPTPPPTATALSEPEVPAAPMARQSAPAAQGT